MPCAGEKEYSKWSKHNGANVAGTMSEYDSFLMPYGTRDHVAFVKLYLKNNVETGETCASCIILLLMEYHAHTM